MRLFRFSPVTLVCWVLCLSLFLPYSGYSQQTVAPTSTVDAAAIPGMDMPPEIPLMIGEKESRYTKQESTNPLEIRFCDSKKTKDYCYSPERMLNRSGSTPTSGVSIEPAVEGEWRWSTDYSLTFTPKKIWPAGQAFKVKFDPTLFPPYVKLNTTEWSFKTENLRATVSSMQFFQDPNDVSKKLVSTVIQFNYPVTDSADKNISFAMETTDDKGVVSRGKAIAYKAEWNSDRTQVALTTPIEKLGEKEQFISVKLDGGIAPVHGGSNIVLTEGKSTERVLVPSLYSYAQIQSVSANIVKNNKFEPEQILMVTTNVPVSSAELTSHLKLRLLPKDKPPVVEGASPKKDYAWSSPTEVKPELLKDAPEVQYTALPLATKEATTHTLKFSAEPGRWLYLDIAQGMKTYGDFILGKNYENTMQVPAYTREVKILPAEGSVMALSGDKKITLFSLGVDSLEVEMGRVLPNQVNQLVSQSSGSFSNPSMNYGFSLDSISERIVKQIKLPGDSPTKPVFTGFDFGEYVNARPNNKGMFMFTVRSKEKNKDGSERVVSEDTRFILVTDLGFLVKKNLDGTREVFVQSLDDGDSVYGATVEVLGKNGLPVTSAVTDWNGHAVIPDLTGMEREKEPVAFLVRDSRDMSFMPFDRYDRALNYSSYEVGGESSTEGGLRAFLFSDRGIYRPGEQVHIGMIVKQGDWTKNLDGLPLQLEIMNPRGQYIIQKTVKLNEAGFIETDFSTKDTSPTGNYNVSLNITKENRSVTQLGSTTVRIEEFQPDTMKITSKFNKGDDVAWVTPDKLEASINLMNLYGTPAADHRVTANINVAPSAFSFKGYSDDYIFYDPKAASSTFDAALTETKTDAQGNATFPLDLKSYGDSTYRLTFYAEGFEEGSGRSVKTAKSILVSSQPYIIGYKSDGALTYINQKSARNVSFLALDPNLKTVAAPDLKLELYGVTYIQTLVQGSSGLSYQSASKEDLVSANPYTLDAKEQSYALDTSKAGDFIVRLKNKDGQVVSQLYYSVVGNEDVTGGTRKDNVVQVKLNKQSYEPGDDIQLSLVSPYTGAGLITIETDKVIAYDWFQADTTNSIQHIRIPKDFAGKGYVNVQFLRARDSKEIYTNPLSIGVASFMVGTDALDSKIALSVPELIKPGEELPISYSTKKPGKIAVFAIDEGILQYGHYKTPDPMKYLVGNRALQVETFQILDQLLPEYSLMQKLSAYGGDMSLGDGKNLNPFKRKSLPPAVYWSGIIDASSETKTLKYKVPEYFNGSLRVMAVAVGNGTVGATETKTTVRADLIVSPNAPLFVAPSDTFEVTSSVANNIKGSGKASIDFMVEPSEGLEVVEGAKQTLSIEEGKEATARILVKAKNVLGNGDLSFNVKSGNSIAHFTASMSVRPPVASNTELLSGYIEKGEKVLNWKRTLYKEFGEANVSVSGLPMSLIPGLAKYLEQFPYGCSEQLVSQTFPTVLLQDDSDFHGTFKNAAEVISNTFTTLQERQTSDNGISLWWSGEGSDSFASIYALHLMTVAKEKNLPVPVGLMNNDIAYVRQYVNRSVTSLEQARQAAYGIYLLTRNGEVTTNYLPYLLQYLEQNKKGVWGNDITAMYVAATYKMLQLDAEANAIVKSFNLGEPKYWTDLGGNPDIYYNELARHGLYLYLLSEHFPDKLKTLDKKVMIRVANLVSEGSYNTISSSYAILGINAYAKAQSVNLEHIAITPIKPDGGVGDVLTLAGKKVLSGPFDPGVNSLKVASPNDGLFYMVSTSGFDSSVPDKALHNGIEVTRSYETKDGTPINEAQIGDEVYVHLTVRAYNDATVENVALVDLLPGGFEIVPESLRDPFAQAASNSEEGAADPNAPVHVSTLDVRNSWAPQAVDIREDRALLMGTFAYPQEFYYRIKAVNNGSFITPPTYATSMYERAISSKGVPGKIAVVKEKKVVPVPAAAEGATDAKSPDKKLPAELPH